MASGSSDTWWPSGRDRGMDDEVPALQPMRVGGSLPHHPLVTLEPADEQNVDLLIQWTQDPVAQGPHKRVPMLSAAELRDLFLHSADRQYFLIRRTADGHPLGRFYYRAWRFGGEAGTIDWEVNLLIANPKERGKGYGTAAQQVVVDYLLERRETRSVFAYTYVTNLAERRALEKVGLIELGPLPHAYYRVEAPPEPCILYVKLRGLNPHGTNEGNTPPRVPSECGGGQTGVAFANLSPPTTFPHPRGRRDLALPEGEWG